MHNGQSRYVWVDQQVEITANKVEDKIQALQNNLNLTIEELKITVIEVKNSIPSNLSSNWRTTFNNINKVALCKNNLLPTLTSVNWINTLNNANNVSEVESNITKIQTTLQNKSGSGSGSDIVLPLPASSVNYTNAYMRC
jgi:chromosomal replication initiation ATPase DnaA